MLQSLLHFYSRSRNYTSLHPCGACVAGGWVSEGALSAFMVVGGGKLFCRSRRLPPSHWKLVFSPGLACDHVRYLTSSEWVDGVGDGHLLILCVCSSSVPVTYCQSTRSVYMNYFHHVLGTQISLHWNVAGVGKGRSRRRRRT